MSLSTPAGTDAPGAPAEAPLQAADGWAEPAPAPSGPTARSRRRRRLLEWVAVIAVAVVAAACVRTFFLQAFYVPSGSMEPTLQVGDRIVVQKVGYTIERGDIVVFAKPPADTEDPDIHDLVKRVIGLPGDTIWSAGGEVYVDGKVLKEPWLPRDDPLGPKGIVRQTIPPGHYFVMGDNRAVSYDSRYWGTVPGSLIIGKVIAIVWRNDRPYFHWF